MKIGILGTGNIGKTLVTRLSQAGHEVKVANSRGPETIDPGILSSGARAVKTEDALVDVDAVILSIPLGRLPGIASLVARLPEETVVIDTSNYYPLRDEKIEAIEGGQVESLWVAEQLGRPIAKAWNAIGSASLAKKARPAGASDRIAIPVAADRERDREVAMSLVDETGLDAFDAGSLANSWRQQPGAPAYCTDLPYAEMGAALDAAERHRLPRAPRPRRCRDAGAPRRRHNQSGRGLGGPVSACHQHLTAQAAASRRRRSMLQRKKSVPSSPMPQHAMGPIQRTTL